MDDSFFSTGAAQSRVLIAGSACVVFSRLTPEDINLFKSLRPESLMMSEKDSDEIAFSLDIRDEEPGSLTEDQALFSTIPSADGKATITILLDPSCKDRQGLVEKKLGPSLRLLSDLEDKLLSQLPEVRKEYETIQGWLEDL